MHKNKRVLLIDADPQCNASQAILPEDILEDIYLGKKSEFHTLYTYLRPLEQGEPKIDSDIRPLRHQHNDFKTDIIPCHPNMSLIEDRLSQAWADLRGGDEIRG